MKASINAITRASLRELASVEAPWCATLLMPSHRAAPENRQDPIRLKNLLQHTEELLVEWSSEAYAAPMLAPVAALVNDTMFWSQQQGGLGFYFWPHGVREFRVPVELPEKVLVTETPWLLPLLPLATDDARFFVLAISGESVRLLEASRYGAADRDLPGAPQGMEDLARFIEEEKQLQFHTGAAPADNAGNRAAVFHAMEAMPSVRNAKSAFASTARRSTSRWVWVHSAHTNRDELGPEVARRFAGRHRCFVGASGAGLCPTIDALPRTWVARPT